MNECRGGIFSGCFCFNFHNDGSQINELNCLFSRTPRHSRDRHCQHRRMLQIPRWDSNQGRLHLVPAATCQWTRE